MLTLMIILQDESTADKWDHPRMTRLRNNVDYKRDAFEIKELV